MNGSMNGKLLSIALAIAMLAPAAGCIDLKSTFNRMPIADFTPQGYFESGSPLTFDGTKSTDYDGNITKWSWDFGDGTNSSVSKPTHVYGDVGNYTVELTVTDNLGKTNSISKPIVISGKVKVMQGDFIQVNYVGKFVNGTIFDTNLFAVALQANQTYGLLLRGNESAYAPMNLYIGNSDKEGYSSYLRMIQGFGEALFNMTVNETKTVTIPPEKGYGIWTTNNDTRIERISEPTNRSLVVSRDQLTNYEPLELNKTIPSQSYVLTGNYTITNVTNTTATLTYKDMVNKTHFDNVSGITYDIIVVNESKFKIIQTAEVGYTFSSYNPYSQGYVNYKIIGQDDLSVNNASIYYAYNQGAPSAKFVDQTLHFEITIVDILRK